MDALQSREEQQQCQREQLAAEMDKQRLSLQHQHYRARHTAQTAEERVFASVSELCNCATHSHFALYVCMYLCQSRLGPGPYQ